MKKKKKENYLKIIYILSLDRKKIENEDISLILETNYPEVKENMNKLIQGSYIKFEDHTIKLTNKGLDIAKKIYKKHELFEDFFKKIIRLSHREAHNYSEILEHISSDEIEIKMAQFLEDYCAKRKIVPLTFLKKGEKGKLVRIEGGFGLRDRLQELGLVGNVEVKVLVEEAFRGPIKLEVRGSEIIIGHGQARRIYVEVEH
ncbi:MAG: metal-dependent transcriptional regulator [Candidatus Helarchaeota archaeon]